MYIIINWFKVESSKALTSETHSTSSSSIAEMVASSARFHAGQERERDFYGCHAGNVGQES